MKDLLVKIFKISLLALSGILIVLLVFGFVLAMNWPWWMGLFLFLIIVGLGIGGYLIRRVMLRRREQRFVQDVIAQDEERLRKLTGAERDEMKALQDQWRDAIDSLRKSHLKQRGNPLYVLPWYLVIGESGSGKTSAINSAHLSSPFTEVKRTSGISGTKNCDWWFFEQAIIMDTAGRYAIPVDEGKDREEWQEFMTLLSRYRKKEPLNGLIVTMAADRLLEAPIDELEEEGRTIRRRVDELMRVLGVRFPVYLMVTKCDLIQGMVKFSEHLPEKNLDQPIGFVNQDLSKDVASLLDRTMKTIGERLRDLRILILHEKKSKTVDPALLVFPEEFEHIKRGLEPFAKSAFQENPYQETPILRGIFFSSGRQEGSPYSHFLESLGLIEEKEVLPGTTRGFFLHEFFAKVLPADRQLFAPTKRTMEWQMLTRNLGLASWVIIVVALCGLLSFSYVKNLRTIRAATDELARPPVLKGEILSDLVTMDHFRQTILNVEAQNRNWWIPRFGLKESLEVEMGLKKKYCKQFNDGFLAAFDKRMGTDMSKLVYSTGSESQVAQYIVHLVRRINLLKARAEGKGYNELKNKPQPSYVSLLASERETGPEVRKKFGLLHLYYLTWRDDMGNITKEAAVLQSWLRDLLGSRGGDLKWLVVWVNMEGTIPPITLGEFWGGSVNLPDERRVPPAFVRKGKEMIDGLIKETESALPDPVFLESKKIVFYGWYRTIYTDTWQQFVRHFPKGSGRLKGVKEWQQAATRMTVDQGPYGQLMNRIPLELEPVSTLENVPLWLKQIYQLQLVKSFKDQGTVAKATEEGRKFVSSIEKILGKQMIGEELETQKSASKAYQDMTTALASIGPAAASRAQAFGMAQQVFNEDPSASKSPFYAGYSASDKLKASMGRGRTLDDSVSALISGPLDFLWTYDRREASCHLQTQWEEKVLAEAQGASGQQAVQILLAPEGAVWKFVKGSGAAAPFIGWNVKKGYYAKEALGGSLAFDQQFFSFLAKGGKVQVAAQAKQGYNVTVRGFPTTGNPDARVKPHSTKIELHCASGVQTLANFNYPAAKAFTWSPDACSDVTFKIEVGGTVLTKKFTGPRAFPDFLSHFPGGKRTFYPSDFPAEKAALENLGIRHIAVHYQFSGEKQVTTLPGHVPKGVARCWAE